MEDFLSILFVLSIGFIWLIPFVLLIKSNRTKGAKKLFWFLIMLFISWFAWFFYLLLVPKPEVEY